MSSNDLDIEELDKPLKKNQISNETPGLPLDIEEVPQDTRPLDIESLSEEKDDTDPLDIEALDPNEQQSLKQELAQTDDGRNFEGNSLLSSKAPGPQRPNPLMELIQAQESRNKMQLLSGLGKAASQAGGALAAVGSGGITQASHPDVSGFDDLARHANQPIEDVQSRQSMQGEQIKLKAEQDLFNPQSSVSQQYRTLLKKAFPKMNVPDTTSAGDIQKSGMVNLARVMASREMMQQNKAETSKEKQAAETDKRFSKLSDKLVSEMASSRSAFGKAANTIRSAEAIERLAANIDPNNLDLRQITEVARNLDSMLSSGQATISGMKKLIPETSLGSASKIAEWISNQPKGANQGAFVNRMLDTVKREKELAAEQIKRTQGKVLSGYTDLKKKDPNRWEEVMQAHELGSVEEPSKSKKEESDPVQKLANDKFNGDYDKAVRFIKWKKSQE